jgi:hypothetical protein
VGLTQAMNLIADDRQTQSVTREILSVFLAAPDTWMTTEDIRRRCFYPEDIVASVLTALAAGRVLDFEPASGAYCYQKDAVLDLEVRRFIRRADGHERLVRTNVDRFRQRHGSF